MKPNNPPRCVRFGPYEADFHTQELRKHGMKLKLSGQPLQILQTLLVRSGQLVTREELQKQLWNDDVNVDSNHGLNAAVNKLRDALNDSAEEPTYIETLPRRGYRFIGTIQAEPSRPAEPAVIPVTAMAPILTRIPPASYKDHGLHQMAERQAIAAAAPPTAIASRRSKGERRVYATAAMVLFGVVVSTVLIGNRKMTQDVPPQKFAVENLASGQRGPQALLQAPRSGGGESARNGEVHGSVPHALTISEKAPGSPLLRTVIDDDSGNAGPQFSPDGRRIVYMSTRTGAWQIWVSNTDGSNPRQVSFTESAGTPRWSPDGRSIAFDAPYEGQTRIFVVKVDGDEQARPMVKGLVPSFSRDGKWIYFASDQTGDWQVWKVPVGGGREFQVTNNGGFAALESADGYIYYSKSRYPQPEICRVPVNGGPEACVLQHLRPRTWASWAVTREGIMFAEDMPNGRPALSLYDPAKRQVRDLISLNSAPFWVGASADGKRAIMNDSEERQISMVDHLP
jgi:DNA-binding winged helix-turn-helix (wHTH) protein